mmetsp:Transcript_117340/g.366775  ORF Transcript_117340/g.366775 Transcript_117340/m.366775 type:complete len:248 (+) Transcript_117340:134-877(+)
MAVLDSLPHRSRQLSSAKTLRSRPPSKERIAGSLAPSPSDRSGPSCAPASRAGASSPCQGRRELRRAPPKTTCRPVATGAHGGQPAAELLLLLTASPPLPSMAGNEALLAGGNEAPLARSRVEDVLSPAGRPWPAPSLQVSMWHAAMAARSRGVIGRRRSFSSDIRAESSGEYGGVAVVAVKSSESRGDGAHGRAMLRSGLASAAQATSGSCLKCSLPTKSGLLPVEPPDLFKALSSSAWSLVKAMR